jgi:hypothetical protein
MIVGGPNQSIEIMEIHHRGQRGNERRKDNAKTQSARRSAEKKRGREEQQKIEPGEMPKWNDWSY